MTPCRRMSWAGRVMGETVITVRCHVSGWWWWQRQRWWGIHDLSERIMLQGRMEADKCLIIKQPNVIVDRLYHESQQMFQCPFFKVVEITA